MRRWGSVAIACVASVTPSLAYAQTPTPGDDTTVSATAEPAAPPVGYGGLPGGLHAQTAEVLPVGTLELGLLSGYGTRKKLLSADHTFNRAIGDIAVAYAPVAHLMLGLSLDGRYDKHKGPAMMSDDGYVGDPHLLVRAGTRFGQLAVGGQLGVWVPGKNAPSIAASATTVDARALVSFDAGFGVVSADAGFRVDNSAKAVDHPEKLTIGDQVSLGVSEFSAFLAGAQLRIAAGRRAYVALEGSTDVFVGDKAPSAILRGGAMAGIAVSDMVTIIGFIEAAKVPGLDYKTVAMTGKVVLVPYEPTVTGGLGVQARFGRSRRVATSQIVRNERPEPVVVIETADVSGVVIDDVGKPVVGARIEVKLKNNTGTAITDDKGAYTIAKLPIGKTVDGKTELDDTGAQVTAEVANKKPGSATLTLAKGANAVPRIALDPMLPPGQLRAVIINVATSRPIAGATVTIEPGGITATSGSDGKFQVDLPPGQYKLTVTARGLAQQQLDVNIQQNGVAIKNIDMHK
jgi:hypothetical protein